VSGSARGAEVPPAPTAPDPLVLELQNPDFVARARAAESLVERGEDALPALGAAGDAPVAVTGGARVSTTEPVVRAILEEATPERLEVHVESPWPVVRRAAAREMGERGRWSAIPRLIERLEDRDARVRAEAAASLRRITNEFIPYRADSSLLARTTGARRWREWWTAVGRLRAAEQDPPEES
jgi:HEAT repeat protein